MALSDSDCGICLQRYVHPVELPCGHIFCFLCIKGCALHRRRCPMCRGRFSMRFLEEPKLVLIPNGQEQNIVPEPPVSSIQPSEISPGGPMPPRSTNVPVTVPTPLSAAEYRWFYEGFTGWWQYDDRTSEELESAFINQLPSFEVQVAGYIYTIDFVHMTQKRKDNSGRKRRIKRDLKDCEKKGIAGIKLSAMRTKPLQSNDGTSNNVLQFSNAHNDLDSPVISPTSQPSIVDDIRSACSLSTSSDASRQTYTRSDDCPARFGRVETCASPVGRSRPITRGYRCPSLTQSSPSPIPELSPGHQVNRTRSSNRLRNSRISRSVPRA
ncbi:E3 ubiquitin-protein ligase [Fasciola hepatica]|uniref:E3 ubiquitin-protein ligase n=1 Tax=Fasciola hepatica TaxID=6192 RepID=A0A4E0R5H3_FASHE|nr:E3 ubiquitin-protein ligase [Fasciola hepatica]